MRETTSERPRAPKTPEALGWNRKFATRDFTDHNLPRGRLAKELDTLPNLQALNRTEQIPELVAWLLVSTKTKIDSEVLKDAVTANRARMNQEALASFVQSHDAETYTHNMQNRFLQEFPHDDDGNALDRHGLMELFDATDQYENTNLLRLLGLLRERLKTQRDLLARTERLVRFMIATEAPAEIAAKNTPDKPNLKRVS